MGEFSSLSLQDAKLATNNAPLKIAIGDIYISFSSYY